LIRFSVDGATSVDINDTNLSNTVAVVGGVNASLGIQGNSLEIVSFPVTEGQGNLALKYKTESVVASGGATEVIPVSVPAGAVLVGASLRNDTAITFGGGGVSYSAAYSGGATQAISAGTASAKNTKENTFFNANAATAITSAPTNITLTPDAGTIDTGTIVAVVYYYELTALTDAA